MRELDQIVGAAVQQLYGAGTSWRFVRKYSARHSEIREYRIRNGQTEMAVLGKRVLNWRGAEPNVVVRREFRTLRDLATKAATGSDNGVPVPLLVVPEQNVIVLTKVDGEPLSRLLKRNAHRLATRRQIARLALVGGQLGEWLLWFHGVTQQPPARFDAAVCLTTIRKCLDRCMAFGFPPEVSDATLHLARNLAAKVDGRLCPVAARHGDFIPQNVLVRDSGVGVVDFENFCERDLVYFDLGSLFGYVAMLRASGFYSTKGLENFGNSFVEAYGQVEAEMLNLYTLKSAVGILAESPRPKGLLRRWRKLSLGR